MKKLVAYITTGFPDLNFTIDLAFALKESGVDMIELGIPFSDPVADGVIIEKANLKSLQNGFRLQHLFDISSHIAKEIDTLWMGYFNPFYKKGVENFISEAKKCGVSGFIIPDLPHEEAIMYKDKFIKNGLALIDFVAPTDSRDRIKTITKDAKKFIYLVAYAGITGSGRDEDLQNVIRDIRSCSDTDIFIGFGVNEKTAQKKAKNVDGVIVGSAFVSILLDENLSNSQKIKKIKNLATIIKEKINQ